MAAPITNADKLEAVRRELKYRRRVYPRAVEKNSMTQQLADRQIALMEAIEADYEQRVQAERLI